MRIAVVVSTVGFHWEELFGAYDEFMKTGCKVELFTVDGSPAKADPISLRHTGPLSLFGLGISARIDPSSPRGVELQSALEGRRALEELVPNAYDALYLPGGHGCLFDVNTSEMLHEKIVELYRGGRLLAAVCHATSTFALAKIDGRSIAAGEQLTGFPQALDDVLIPMNAVHEDFLPLPLSNEEVLRREGVDVPRLDALRGSLNPRHICISPPFITGVGPKSARRVARALVSTLRTQTPETATLRYAPVST